MKTREEILQEVLALNNRNIILSMSTGVGKTKIALEKVKQIRASSSALYVHILVVAPTLSILNSWNDEIIKWNASEGICYFFTTYASLHKYTEMTFNMVIFDEGHHITERVFDIMKLMHFSKSMILSATIPPTLSSHLRYLLPDLYIYKVNTKEAIENNILPDPKVILLPLQFNVKDLTETIVKNPKVTNKVMKGEFSKRHLYRDKNTRYEIPCTEAQYNLDLDNMIDWYKNKAMSNVAFKNLWLNKAGNRLKWLASKKNPYVKEILKVLKKERTLTFCSSIEQTALLGKNCIHSKNKEALSILESFNTENINHITAVAMLDEGVNVTNCRIGIFANINSSERIQIQRVGRILRHSSPIIIIPYFKNSREQEIVTKMLEGYNKDLIVSINSINELRKWI